VILEVWTQVAGPVAKEIRHAVEIRFHRFEVHQQRRRRDLFDLHESIRFNKLNSQPIRGGPIRMREGRTKSSKVSLGDNEI
jgi:hypothetical protein